MVEVMNEADLESSNHHSSPIIVHRVLMKMMTRTFLDLLSLYHCLHIPAADDVADTSAVSTGDAEIVEIAVAERLGESVDAEPSLSLNPHDSGAEEFVAVMLPLSSRRSAAEDGLSHLASSSSSSSLQQLQLKVSVW